MERLNLQSGNKKYLMRFIDDNIGWTISGPPQFSMLRQHAASTASAI
jgi:hypothetical protein